MIVRIQQQGQRVLALVVLAACPMALLLGLAEDGQEQACQDGDEAITTSSSMRVKPDEGRRSSVRLAALTDRTGAGSIICLSDRLKLAWG